MKLVEITDEFKNSPVSKEQAIDFLIKKRKSLQHQLKSTTEKWERAIASNEEYTRIYKLAQRRQDIQAAIDRSYNALNQLQNKYMSPRDIESIIRCNFMEASETVHKHILWIDDLRHPPASIENNCDIARTYDEAVSMLSKYKYTDIYLDHDLGDFTGPGGRERTGYDIVIFLADLKNDGKYVPLNFHMLTSNPVGKKNMEQVISRYLRS